MEHLPINSNYISLRTGIHDKKKLILLTEYAKEIFTENQKFNLTGFKTLNEIILNLIIGSLEPIQGIDVPRGTVFADIGTGAGIPGIPIAINYKDTYGYLFDSNRKKIEFINSIAKKTNIKNIITINKRIEQAGRHSEFRNKFDWVFSRAMSDIYVVSELAAPLMKIGGYLYIYRNKYKLDEHLYSHFKALGLCLYNLITEKQLILNNDHGIILKKIINTDKKFPRQVIAIKRDASKYI